MRKLVAYITGGLVALPFFIVACAPSAPAARVDQPSGMTVEYLGTVNSWYVNRFTHGDVECYTYSHGIACLRKESP